ncbi:hopanoid biosynthesis-associated protein HpnK [Hypericibacter sp.]|uniref:hopanoid biosynthesis-associated protein HpnK n=1 Tax=Hypericibacter sp. TaxID=2705401 RepID=UPI003D6D63F7
MKGVIVTADDFGAAIEINEAVEAAHRDGILTAASLMVTGMAAADAVARAKRLPALRVGLHLVLVEGTPALPPAEIPDLVDAGGLFRSDMASMGVDMFFRPAVRRQLTAEIAAQFEAFRATGLRLDHVNAHKHFHLHPTVAGRIIAIGRRFGMSAARVPAEPAAILRRIEPGSRAVQPMLLAPVTGLLQARFAMAGLLVPRQVFGLTWSGAMTESRLAGVLRHLPAGLSEIYLHPAVSNDFPGAAPGYGYAQELAALMAPSVLAALQETGAARGGFGDFKAAEFGA